MPETIRPIQPTDNDQLAELIRTVMSEFGCVGDGYSITDPEVDNMYEAYSPARHRFWVIEDSCTNRILGGGGIGTLAGAGNEVCELKKMYFYPELRGKGWGRKMIDACLEDAKQFGYKTCYIETVPRMESAIQLYTKVGFKALEAKLGNTGHCKCESFFALDL